MEMAAFGNARAVWAVWFDDDDKKARDLFVQWSQEATKSVSMASATFSHVGRGGTRTPHLS